MKNLQMAIDFVEGKINVDEFMRQTKDSNVLDLLQSLVPTGTRRCVQKAVGSEVIAEVVPYDVKEVLIELYALGTMDAKVNIFAEVRDILVAMCPDIKVNNAIIDKFRFILVHTPPYIGGAEAEKVLERIYDQMKIKRVKLFKDIVKQKFTVLEKPPKWIQAPEWPIDEKGNPLQFLYEKWINKESKAYFFRRVDSETVESIKQSF